ncbi:MAG: MATE family efflux transporter [archaeon]|nr:MATE family efflux transporter [archaeon]
MYKRRHELIKSKFNEFFLPTLFTSMANNTCLFADSLIVSFLIGAINLSAIQVVSPVVNLVNLIYWMIGLGGSVLASVAKAEYDDEKSNFYFTVSMVSLIVLGIIIMVFGLLFSDTIINILCSTEQIKPLAKQFFTIMIIGMPFLCYMMSLSYFIRTDGMPNLPLIAILISNIANIILDFVYINVFGMGVGGAALATVSGYILGSLYITRYFFKSKRTFKLLSRAKIKLNRFFAYLKEICTSGFSSSSTQLFITLKLFAINILISWVLGKSGLIAFSVCNNIAFIIYMFLIGTSQTMSPIVSVYNQEEDYSGVNYTIKRSLKIALTSSIIIAGIFILFPQIAIMLFSVKNPADIPVVFTAVRLYAISFIGLAVTFVMMFYGQAIKKNLFASTVSCIEGFLVPVLGAYLLVPLIGFVGIWIAFILAEIIAILYIFIYSKHVERKSNGEYSGFFMIKKVDYDNVLDLTTDANLNDCVDLARNVESYLKDKNINDLTAVRVGLAIEEMLVNIINTNENLNTIDVLVKIKSDKILISLKDQGKEFNPTIERDDCEFSNINVLKNISDKIDYARVLGLHSTVITIVK